MNMQFDSLIRDILKILWKRGEVDPKEQLLLFSTILCCLLVDLCVKTGTRFSLRDKRLFEIREVEITRVDCIKISSTAAETNTLRGKIQLQMRLLWQDSISRILQDCLVL